MKIELDELTLGHSTLTDSVFVGTITKKGDKWKHKKDVTNSFIDCIIQRWENQTEVIQAGDEQWEITVKKLK